ncbi:hypothetical protein QUA40_19235 [Microcoleus sp. Pol11C3]|uniref:hypothetical protein n=1 Tax=Microcoleus sp. Pol11C3 TaxID=3055390 RepID=UPI002FCFD37E
MSNSLSFSDSVILNPVMPEGCLGCERPARFRKLQRDHGKIIIPMRAIELSPELARDGRLLLD